LASSTKDDKDYIPRAWWITELPTPSVSARLRVGVLSLEKNLLSPEKSEKFCEQIPESGGVKPYGISTLFFSAMFDFQ